MSSIKLSASPVCVKLGGATAPQITSIGSEVPGTMYRDGVRHQRIILAPRAATAVRLLDPAARVGTDCLRGAA